MITPSRRQLLRASAGLAASPLLGLPALASTGDRRFIFVVNFGGWDVTRVLFPAFDHAVVDVEPEAAPWSAGGLRLVDHPQRAGVRRFFETWASQTLLVHGVLVPSVAHMACLRLILTGRISGRPDWPALLGAGAGEAFALPHLVLSGPSYPAELGAYVTRTGGSGQLDALLTGEIADWSATPVPRTEPLIAEAERAVVQRRLDRARADGVHPQTAALLDAYGLSIDRAEELKEATRAVRWDSGGSFAGDALLAVDLLSRGLTRAVTLTYDSDWDTHALNDIWQNWHWQGLFDGLTGMMDALASTPGQVAPTLAQETVVVVLSEMGRTPGLNAEDGKDHWPYTSAMILGPGVTGGRQVGGYDALYYGERVDLDSGEADPSGEDLTCETLGATLLALAGLDPEEHLPGVRPIDGVLT